MNTTYSEDDPSCWSYVWDMEYGKNKKTFQDSPNSDMAETHFLLENKIFFSRWKMLEKEAC